MKVCVSKTFQKSSIWSRCNPIRQSNFKSAKCHFSISANHFLATGLLPFKLTMLALPLLCLGSEETQLWPPKTNCSSTLLHLKQFSSRIRTRIVGLDGSSHHLQKFICLLNLFTQKISPSFWASKLLMLQLWSLTVLYLI